MITVKVYSETAGDRTAARTSLFQDIYLYIDIYLRIIYIFDDCSVSPWTHGSHLYRYICLSQYQCVVTVRVYIRSQPLEELFCYPSISSPWPLINFEIAVNYERTAGSSWHCGGRRHERGAPLWVYRRLKSLRVLWRSRTSMTRSIIFIGACVGAEVVWIPKGVRHWLLLTYPQHSHWCPFGIVSGSIRTNVLSRCNGSETGCSQIPLSIPGTTRVVFL